MPQRPKQEVRARFVEVAAQLFAEHGYTGTSLRTVVSSAGGSLGNLRNYFPTKDDLFAAACEPVLADVRAACVAWVPGSVPGQLDEVVRLDVEAVQVVANYIVAHRRQLSLLLTRSEGSSLAGWSEALFDTYVEIERRKLDTVVASAPGWLACAPSPLLVRALCRMYFDLAKDFVGETIDQAQFWEALHEYDAFRRAGFAVYLQGDS
ncbi:MAG: TetR/AcrR family transcriptional regulator [Myxococcota bacterium]